MMGLNRKSDESLGDFVHRQHSCARAWLVKCDALISTVALRKYWRYVGHCIRNEMTILRDAILYRDGLWWASQKGLRHPIARHRTSGTQLQHFTQRA
eukprot:12398864-Karenia_brevis.AAC.1